MIEDLKSEKRSSTPSISEPGESGVSSVQRPWSVWGRTRLLRGNAKLSVWTDQ